MSIVEFQKIKVGPDLRECYFPASKHGAGLLIQHSHDKIDIRVNTICGRQERLSVVPGPATPSLEKHIEGTECTFGVQHWETGTWGDSLLVYVTGSMGRTAEVLLQQEPSDVLAGSDHI